MTWFFAVLIVVLTGIVGVVAAGRGGTMAEVYDDRPDARVPADGPLTAGDVRRVRFTTALRGYRMSEVDSLLARLADELEEARRWSERGVSAPSAPAPSGPAPSGHEESDPAEADPARSHPAESDPAEPEARPDPEDPEGQP